MYQAMLRAGLVPPEPTDPDERPDGGRGPKPRGVAKPSGTTPAGSERATGAGASGTWRRKDDRSAHGLKTMQERSPVVAREAQRPHTPAPEMRHQTDAVT